MEDMLAEIEAGENTDRADAAGKARALAVLLEEHKGADVVALDLRQMNTWTDFFVIATASSGVHLEGLERHIKEFICGQDLEIIRRSSRPSSQEDEWRILDLGAIVVHLMSGRTRSFYELERLYPPPQVKVIFPATLT